MSGETIDTRLGPITVERVGQGSPVLFWHSLFVDGRSWDRVIRSLAGRYACIVVDGPGHGASPGPGHRFGLDDCAEAAGDVLDALAIDRVDWVGNAWGGHVGYLMAAHHPDRVRTLTAIASPLPPLTRHERRAAAPLVALYPLLGPRVVAPKILDVLLTPAVRAADPDATEAVTAALRRPGRRALQHTMRSVMLDRPDLTATAGRVTCPTLVLVGEDDALWTADQARRIHPSGPHVEVVTVAGSRHLAPLEAPGTVAGALEAHWAAVVDGHGPTLASNAGGA